jgi:hypothetical protein
VLKEGDVVTVLGKASKAYVDALLHIDTLHIVLAGDEQSLFTGLATSIIDIDDIFSMETDDGNPLVSAFAALEVTLAEDGARIFDKYGNVAGNENIYEGTDVDVFGLASPDLATVKNVKAAFVIYDNDKNNSNITGTIADIYGTASQISVSVVDGQATINECVDVNGAYMFLLKIVGNSIVRQEITINDLKIGMSVDAYGDNSAPSCMSADVVLVTE